MRPIIIDMKDLSESTEIYESSPNKLAVIFVYIMLAFTLIAFAWMSLFSIDEVVNTEGILVKTGDQSYQMVTYIADHDYGKIHVGQDVKFEILAYPANEYSYFHGQIQEISEDQLTDPETGISYYMVTIEIGEGALKDRNGNDLAIANGLSCRANIVTGHETVLRYLMKNI